MAYKWMGHDIAAPLTIKSDRTIWTVEKLDKSIDRGASTAQRWLLDFAVVCNTDEADLMIALATGMEDIYEMRMPSMNGVKERALALNGFIPSNTHLNTAAQLDLGDTEVSLVSTVDLTIPRGTFTNFGSKDKVYMLPEDVVMTAGVPVTAPIFPMVNSSVANNAHVLPFDQCDLKYYIDTTMMQGITYTDGVLTGIDRVQLIEAL